MKNRNLIVKICIIEALFFAFMSICSYQTTFLIELGISSSQIGSMTSIGLIIGLLCVPVWGIISDRMHSAFMPLVISLAVCFLLVAILPVFGAKFKGVAYAFFLYLGLQLAFRQPSNSLLDSWAVSYLARENVGYGTARLWGSVSYAAVSVLFGLTVGKIIALENIFYLAFAVGGALLLFIVLVNRRYCDAPPKKGAREKVKLSKLLKNKRLMLYVILTIGLNIYIGLTLMFMAYIVEYAGCDKSQIGLVVGLRSIVEISVMLFSAKFCRKVKIEMLLVVAGLAFGIEHCLYRYSSGLWSLLLMMLFSGIGGGLFYSLGPDYVKKITDPSVINTAQSLPGITMTLVGIIGSFVGGKVIGSYGIQSLTTACGIIILGLTAVFATGTMVLRSKEQKEMLDSGQNRV